MRILKPIKNGLHAKFKGLRVILSWQVDNTLGVLLLCKILRNLIEFKPSKTSCERVFFSIRIVFLKKCSNFNQMFLGSCTQIKYIHKLNMHKANFAKNMVVRRLRHEHIF